MTRQTKAALFCIAASVSAARTATAQAPQPIVHKPNILLIVDTSGSMEYKTGDDTYPTCNPGNTLALNERSRWTEVAEVLTGTINGFSCEEMDRTTSIFSQEFEMPDGTPPSDVDYRHPYHRILSNSCAITPDRWTPVTNAFDWNAMPVRTDYPVDPNVTPPPACTTAFNQSGDGFIDSFDSLVRFGLMTFDPLPDPQEGFDTSFSPQYPEGVQGTWSYFGNTSATGHPADCDKTLTNADMEVGVRNGAAPVSEGRMVYFGDPIAGQSVDTTRHTRIQEVLLATRPYGATPINGALDDARYFFWQDADPDPLDPTLYLSPRFDDYVNCGCREQHIILITDGEPNLDLRPYCDEAYVSIQGVCPYPETPAEILKDLYDKPTSYSSCSTAGANQYRIRTHVVGFSTDTYASGTKDCVDLKTDYPDWDTPLTGTCALATDEDLKVCCTLHELAKAGSNSNTAADSKDSDGEPYIAPDSAALQLALSQIVSGLIRASASGTRPVRSPGVGSAEDRAEMVAFRLLTSYETNTGTSGLYRGNIERLRWKCESGVPVEQPKDLAKGDDFGYLAAKFNSDREFVTYLPSTFTAVDLGKSIRPLLAGGVSDGVTNGATAGARATAVGDAFTDLISEVALNLPLITDPTFPTECPNAANQTQCRDQIMDWHLGYSDNVLPTPNERCASYTNQANCSVIADVLHSTPVIVDKPTAPLEDETYQTFATAWKNRMMMAYVSSNDGFLHGFATSPNDTTDPKVLDDTATNEHFAFVPPLLLPQLKGQYPGANKTFLDGSAIVQDVVATGTNFPYMLEREAGKEGDVGATNATWRTILVQGFGGAQSGYFALDITDTDKPSNGATSGPRFLWQLTTTDANGQPLFGKGGTPTIATINLNNVETAVAILPGGEGGTPSGTTTRRDPQRLNPSSPNTHYKVGVSGGSPPRTDITNYTTGLESRSLTIVRLDSGEILRSFRADPAEVTDLDSSLITGNSGVAPYLDSPITGIPAAFPAGPGMIADRIFVGDKDGTLWRVDVSATDPGDWEMKLFYDAYTGTDGATNGKPIAIAPTLSVNEFGQITVAFGTGDQDLSGGPGDIQYVYSLAEAEDSNAFISKVNWYHRWDSGEHLLGPMSLLAGNLYFSTLDPSGADVCNALGANIYGEDYVLPADIANLGLGGLGRLQPSGSATVYQSQSANGLVAAQGGGGGVSSIFGFSLEFTPSCYVSAPTPLSYLTGSRTAVTNPSSSQLQLVFQTASAAQTTTGALQFQTGFEAINLAPPRQASTVLSWAAILD